MSNVTLSYQVRQPNSAIGGGFVIARVNGGEAFPILAHNFRAFFIETGLIGSGNAATGYAEVPAEVIEEAAGVTIENTRKEAAVI